MPVDKWYEVSQINPDILLGLAFGFAVFTFIVVFGTYRYQRWRRFKVFVEEMKTLNLDSHEEGALSDIVKRYAMNEPVQILYSQRIFDDLACKEMRRILSGSGSIEAKEKFIDSLYEIRTKTYSPVWLSEPQLYPDKIEAA